MVRGDATYKSSTIHVGSGEPPNSGAFFLHTGHDDADSSVVSHAAPKPEEEEGAKSRACRNGCEFSNDLVVAG